MLHAAFVRSPAAHARIRGVDLGRAKQAPGVIFALSGIELAKNPSPRVDTQLSLPKKMDRAGPAQVPQPAAAAARAR